MSQPFTLDGPPPPSGVVRVVGFSGGIDSQATALWVRRRFPAGEINWVDDVVTWSKTSRGGRLLELPMLDSETQPEVCSSLYGLCE